MLKVERAREVLKIGRCELGPIVTYEDTGNTIAGEMGLKLLDNSDAVGVLKLINLPKVTEVVYCYQIVFPVQFKKVCSYFFPWTRW